ncbi:MULTISPECIES: sigma-70 family RNA polymerase sigma factor [unclassified Crossiella]|uniref:sigma-70 family RNA polymerase sigma factor n=1 Tax=unclassified Crossiella TaxID=2620835 RepID=UPI0020004577|nr:MULTISPECIES: sigma-70 family RNA polymerase sigma factor [unclassified Crossiella]MCK2238367.1 sigma-70 family RNA polymerase sigma factor [Crossiella sp. S99.2]MCK2256407.1 sigma-70 family RNA polymerase sigma factor [Crossiella sp. S99.1]
MQTQEPTDADLVRAAAAGSSQSFATLYARHWPAVAGFVRRMVRDPHLAEDLSQEAFVSALRNLADLREPERFRPWLVSIAHRAALDHLRRPGPALLPELPELVDGEASPAEAAAAHEAARLVWDAAASLEPRQLAVLELTVREGLSGPELAQALDVRANHAAVLAHRARSALGNAVRMLLVARNPRRCPRLAELVPGRPQSLSLPQRMSVDRHLRRCPQCRDLAGRLTTPLTVLGVLFAGASVAADHPALLPVNAGNSLVFKASVPVALAAALAVGYYLLPHPVDPPQAAPPPPATSTSTTTAEPTTTTPPPPSSSTPPTSTTRPRPSSTPPSTAPAGPGEALTVLINDRRSAAGCPPLRQDPRLNTAARQHSTDMMKNNYIGMSSPDGTSVDDRARAAGYQQTAGAAVAAYRETAKDMAPTIADDGSPALRCDVRSVGISRAVGGECHYYWTVIYGRA